MKEEKDPKKPIILNREGDMLKANNRTLGADDGIGLATALAIDFLRFPEAKTIFMLSLQCFYIVLQLKFF